MFTSGSSSRWGEGLGRRGWLAMKRAVVGSTCISPTAPRSERSSGTKPLSCWMTAATSVGSTPQREDSVRIVAAWSSGYQSRAYQAGIARWTAYQAPRRATRTSPATTRARRRRRRAGGRGTRSGLGRLSSIATGPSRVVPEPLGDPALEVGERALVEVPAIGAGAPLLVGDLPARALAERLAPSLDPAAARRLARADRDHGVEVPLAPGLVEERHLAHEKRRRGCAGPLRGLPARPARGDQRVEERLQELHAARLGERPRAARAAVDPPVGAE